MRQDIKSDLYWKILPFEVSFTQPDKAYEKAETFRH
jgi:hypothetical protein